MKTSRIIIASLVGAFVLFLHDGVYQAIPNFGISSVERIESDFLKADLSPELTDRMTYIMTDETVSFVATRDAEYYDLSRFFIIESSTVVSIAIIFSILFARLPAIDLRGRLWLTLAFALIASLAIHLPYLNWWGFSAVYTIGVILKTITGWLLISYIQNRLIYKIQ